MQVEDERKGAAAGGIKNSGFFKKLKSIKNLRIIIIIFIIAIGLIIYSSVMTSLSAKDDGATSVMTSDEQRLSAILSNIDGAGEVETMITQSDGKIVGVIVIADGARDIAVRLRLMDAASTALGIDKNLVNVYTRK